jgi:hypothetical protein
MRPVIHFLAAFGDLPTGESATLAAEGLGMMNEIIVRLRSQAVTRHLHERVDG